MFLHAITAEENNKYEYSLIVLSSHTKQLKIQDYTNKNDKMLVQNTFCTMM